MQLAHYECARRFERFHLWLGLPAIALGTIVGTAVFASLEKSADVRLQIGVGLLSVVAAVLTGLQTFLRYAELAEKHRLAGARFANLKHRIELLTTLQAETEIRSQLVAIEDTWAKLREESPSLSSGVWRHIEQQVQFGQPLYGFGEQTP
ncbi:SLATT domain-containing protein [Diaphorobacter aerolatus]|uniref:SLATT domain-containing protein n=1 Tax=Diaphorobacter aerolatus TaxID=1288495 RepID=UPI0021F75EB5|nr:SLATT domain-containing protein [Diaphorobacter aerolatus]